MKRVELLNYLMEQSADRGEVMILDKEIKPSLLTHRGTPSKWTVAWEDWSGARKFFRKSV